MYAAWAAPTVSDATKLELVPWWHPATGARMANNAGLYRLKYVLVYSTDWADAAGWTEVDGGGNVSLAGGVWSFNGDGASYTTNGIYKTDGITRIEGFIEVKHKGHNKAASTLFQANVNSAAALANTWQKSWSPLINARVSCYHNAEIGRVAVVDGTWYTLRTYFSNPTADGLWCQVMFTIEGGAYTIETFVAQAFIYATGGLPDPFYPKFNRYTNDAAEPNEIKEFRWYGGFSAAGPTLTYVHDCGADRAYSDIVLTNIAAVGGWDTTNVTFAWSCDDGVAAYTAEHTLAQMQAHGALTESHRYFRLRITVNSDGATQQYAGEMNASDLVSAIINTAEVWPSEDDVRDGVDFGPTGADYTGNATFPAEGDVQSGVQYGTDGTEYTGTFTEPGVANVELGVQYGAGGVEFTGTFVVPSEDDVELGVDYGAAAEFTGNFEAPPTGDVRNLVGYGSGGVEFVGTFVVPAEGDVEFGVGYGAAGVEFTGAFVVPAEGDVEAGVTYGAAAEFTGTFVVPSEDDVEFGVNYGNAAEFTGNFVVPIEATVQLGVTYGAGGVEFTGTLVGGGGWDPDEVDGIDTGLTARQALRLMVAVLCGKTTVVPGTPGHAIFRDTADTRDRVDATMVGSERVDVDYDKS